MTATKKRIRRPYNRVNPTQAQQDYQRFRRILVVARKALAEYEAMGWPTMDQREGIAELERKIEAARTQIDGKENEHGISTTH